MRELERQGLPSTPDRSFEKEPEFWVRAEGMRFGSQPAEPPLDASSGLFRSALGHGRCETGSAGARARGRAGKPESPLRQPAAALQSVEPSTPRERKVQ